MRFPLLRDGREIVSCVVSVRGFGTLRLFTRTVSYLRDATRVPGLSIPRTQYRVCPSYPKCFPSGFKNGIILASTISDATAILTKNVS